MDHGQTSSEPTGRAVGGTEYSWCRAITGGTGITVLALHLSRRIPYSLLLSALNHLQKRHPILRSRLTRTNPNDHPFISIPPSSDPLLESHRSPLLDLHSTLELELNRNPWADEANGARVFFATAYENADSNSVIIALRFHTGLCDRTSAVAILKELLGILSAGEEEEQIGNEGKDGVILGIEELIPKKDSWKPFWARGKDLVGYSLNGLRTSGLPFKDVDSARSSEVVRMVVGRAETDKILSACQARGIKLFAALSAAGLIATVSSKQLENKRSETYSVVTLVDCRKYLEPVLHDHNIGFYHSAIMNTHTVHEGQEVWEVAVRCRDAFADAMSNKKHLTDMGELNFLMCKAIENPVLTPSSSLRTALISVFAEPVVYESCAAKDQLGVEDYLGCASVHGVGPSIAVFDTIRDGQLDCAFLYPSPLHSRKQMQELVEHMQRMLVEGSLVDDEGHEA